MRWIAFTVPALVLIACGTSDKPTAYPTMPASTHVAEPAPTPAPTPTPTPAPTPPPLSSGNGTPVDLSKLVDAGPPREVGNCDDCTTTVPSDLRTAFNKRAEATKDCYVRVLNTDSKATPKVGLEVRVGRDGNVCSIMAHVEKPEYPGFADCVTNVFRREGFIKQPNACVIGLVPIEYQPQTK